MPCVQRLFRLCDVVWRETINGYLGCHDRAPQARIKEIVALCRTGMICSPIPDNPKGPDMNDQMQALTAAITKADIAMKAAAWQIEQMRSDIDQLRKCLFELAYTAEEHGINLVNLTKNSQDTIVAMRLGGFK